MFRNLRVVLFDLDGTLIETHIDFPAMAQAVRAMAQEAGVSPESLDGLDILGAVAQTAGLLGDDGPAFRARAFARLEEMEIVGCSTPTLLPGASKLLAGLREQGVRVGVVTRNCRRVSERLLTEFGLAHDGLFTRDDVGKTKPHPEHLWDALAAFGIAPQNAAMVGDNWMDIQAGRAAGCALTVGLLGPHGPDRFAACPPDALARDLQEVGEILRGR